MTVVNAIESVTGDVYQGKQTTLGTIQPPTDTATKHLRAVGDDSLKPAKTYGSEEWVDGKSWGSPGMYVDSIGGDVGSIANQGQIETAGFQVAQIVGVDTVTGTTPDYTHTMATGAARGAYQTFRIKTGATVLWRNSFFDAKVKNLQMNIGQDQKVMRMTQNIWALKAANWYTTDPTVTDSGTDPFNWAEGASSHSIGGTVFTEIDGETLELETNLSVYQGDNPAPICFIPGKGEITRTFSGIVTDGTLPVIQNALYSTTTMTDGLAVSSTVNSVALVSTYTRTSVRSIAFTTGKAVVDPADFMIGPKAEGGTIPISFGGRCLESSGVILTTVAKTGDATAYV